MKANIKMRIIKALFLSCVIFFGIGKVHAAPLSDRVVSSTINLRGKVLTLEKGQNLVFTSKGCIKNGTIHSKGGAVSGTDHLCFKNVVLKGEFSGSISDECFYGADNVVLANMLLFDEARITRNYTLDSRYDPAPIKGDFRLYSDQENRPVIETTASQIIIGSQMNVSGDLSVENIRIIDKSIDLKDAQNTVLKQGYKRYALIGLNGNRHVHFKNVDITSVGAICISGNYYGNDVLEDLVLERCRIQSLDFSIELARWGRASFRNIVLKDSSIGCYYASDRVKGTRVGPFSVVTKDSDPDSSLRVRFENSTISDGYCEIAHSSDVSFVSCKFIHAQPVFSTATDSKPTNRNVFVKDCEFNLYNDICSFVQNFVGDAEKLTLTGNRFISRSMRKGTNIPFDFFRCGSVVLSDNKYYTKDGEVDSYFRFDKSVGSVSMTGNQIVDKVNGNNKTFHVWIPSSVKIHSSNNNVSIEAR